MNITSNINYLHIHSHCDQYRIYSDEIISNIQNINVATPIINAGNVHHFERPTFLYQNLYNSTFRPYGTNTETSHNNKPDTKSETHNFSRTLPNQPKGDIQKNPNTILQNAPTPNAMLKITEKIFVMVLHAEFLPETLPFRKNPLTIKHNAVIFNITTTKNINSAVNIYKHPTLNVDSKSVPVY